MTDRLFDIEEYPELPLFREPRRSRGEHDARFRNDYPPEWHRCPDCEGLGWVWGALREGAVPAGNVQCVWRLNDDVELTTIGVGVGAVGEYVGYRLRDRICAACLGMGSVKAKVRLLEGFRCERCRHRFVPKDDARRLGVARGTVPWSPCDTKCSHNDPIRLIAAGQPIDLVEPSYPAGELVAQGMVVEAKWRVMTVHHLDGDKANLAWWNLACLCQVCHLYIQNKVVMERVWPHEHSPWFKPHAAGFYAVAYLGEDLTRNETMESLDELLALERSVA